MEWNDGYYQEGYDRCHVVMTMIHEILNEHPAVVKCGVQGKIDIAMEALMDAYQKISEEEYLNEVEEENRLKEVREFGL